jgi:hypothetical protein
MPRSLQEILDHAAELAYRAEFYEPRPDDEVDSQVYVALRDAVSARAAAENALAAAVDVARSQGMSWAKIGAVIGTSGEAARQRYGRQQTGTAASSSASTAI